jgi:hypothetical protein
MGTLNAGKTAEATFGKKADPLQCLVLMYRLAHPGAE